MLLDSWDSELLGLAQIQTVTRPGDRNKFSAPQGQIHFSPDLF